MEASDAADQLRESVEDERVGQDQFKTRAAIIIGIMAMLLAIASLGGENSMKAMIDSNIHASDTWAFYQAKNIRQTANELAANDLETMLLVQGPTMGEEARQQIQQRIDRYRATVARYESEPDPTDPTNPLKGEGKRELTARAQDWESKRDNAQRQDPNFDFSIALFQIAIVMGSVAIIAMNSRLLALSVIAGCVATLLMINGFFLLVDLPG
ncbi:MAG TPA: DUF4337 domain-containing protein [Chloroflexota bacterium]|jgi:hypothetical protein|nr:DUF4337 domain-containing protein [Chloroflexota bacterium]